MTAVCFHFGAILHVEATSITFSSDGALVFILCVVSCNISMSVYGICLNNLVGNTRFKISVAFYETNEHA